MNIQAPFANEGDPAGAHRRDETLGIEDFVALFD
jgi:hypothetical protein